MNYYNINLYDKEYFFRPWGEKVLAREFRDKDTDIMVHGLMFVVKTTIQPRNNRAYRMDLSLEIDGHFISDHQIVSSREDVLRTITSLATHIIRQFNFPSVEEKIITLDDEDGQAFNDADISAYVDNFLHYSPRLEIRVSNALFVYVALRNSPRKFKLFVATGGYRGREDVQVHYEFGIPKVMNKHLSFPVDVMSSLYTPVSKRDKFAKYGVNY